MTELLASTGAVVGTYRVGPEPSGMAFDGANIWVANYGSDTVMKIGVAAQLAPLSSAAIW